MTDGGAGRESLLRPVVVAWAVLGAIAISFVAVLASANGASTVSGRVGGDFPAFYGAGSIVADGDVDLLYDLDRQVEAQSDLHTDEDSVLYFAYPPPVAAVYALFTGLPYVAAYALHTLVMLGAALGAWWLLRPLLPRPLAATPVVAAVGLTFVPSFMGVNLGQNSAVVLLLVAAMWRFSAEGRQIPAGLAVGLLLFKPQYAVPLIGLQFLRGRYRTVAAAVATAGAWWLAGTAMLGTAWVGAWVDQVSDFTALDAEVNGSNAVSWLGIAEHVFGVGSTAATALGGTLAVITVLCLVALWIGRDDDALALPMAGAAAGILLVSPHAMFYDATVLVLVVAGLAAARHPKLPSLIAAGWVLGAMHPTKNLVGVTPVAVVVIGSFLAVLHAWWTVGIRRPEPTVARLGSAPPVEPPMLSVVIPAFNEAGRIEPTLERLETWLVGQPAAEVIVVDDGSTDDTAARVLRYRDRLPYLRVLQVAENRGKGHAVRIGMLEAVGQWRAFLDADGSTDPDQLPRLLATGAPVAIASVATEDAVLERAQSGVRSSLGRFGNRVIQALVLPGIEDSQRGCKVLRGDLAEAIFRQCTVDGWGFDVEVLARARQLGVEPVEVGITWEHRPVGHVRPWHYLTTIAEVLRVRAAVGHQPPVRSREPVDRP